MRCYVLSRDSLGKILESAGNTKLIYYLNYYGGRVVYKSYEHARKLFRFKTRSGVFKRIKKLEKQQIVDEVLELIGNKKFYILSLTGLTDVK